MPAIAFERTGPETVLVKAEWPTECQFTAALFGVVPETVLRLRWPWVIVTAQNGWAAYKVDTCDLGRYTGRLIESWYDQRVAVAL